MSDPESPVILEHLFRRQAGRIVSCLTRRLGTRHLQLAEDAVQESMLQAFRLWPLYGVPAQPEAWLLRVAKNYALSTLKRSGRVSDTTEELDTLLLANAPAAAGIDVEQLELEQSLRDDELCMIFLCCAPELPKDVRIALSLKLVSGFSVGEIARIFLEETETIAQRLVRAKRLIRQRNLRLTMPRGTALRDRLDSVLEVIYFMFSSGYATSSGEEMIRRDVCLEAIRLGRLLAASSIVVPQVHALAALMSLQAARLPARLDGAGDLVLLEDQDRSLWDDDLIRLGFHHLNQMLAGEQISEWHIQAAIAAVYAQAKWRHSIDWQQILHHYDDLIAISDSPVVALNRAVAVMKVQGAAAALAAVEPLLKSPLLSDYYLLPAVKGSILSKLSRFAEAEAALTAALACICSIPEKRYLLKQLESVRAAAACQTVVM